MTPQRRLGLPENREFPVAVWLGAGPSRGPQTSRAQHASGALSASTAPGQDVPQGRWAPPDLATTCVSEPSKPMGGEAEAPHSSPLLPNHADPLEQCPGDSRGQPGSCSRGPGQYTGSGRHQLPMLHRKEAGPREETLTPGRAFGRWKQTQRPATLPTHPRAFLASLHAHSSL